jgi:hypothetical protein
MPQNAQNEPHRSVQPSAVGNEVAAPFTTSVPTSVPTPLPTSQPPATSAGTTATTATLVKDRMIDLTVFEADPTRSSNGDAARSKQQSVNPNASQSAASPQTVNPMISLAVFVAIVAFAILKGQVLLLGIVAALAGMIFLHELGHFMASRLTNTKATEFFVGFGPRLVFVPSWRN